MQEQLPSSYRGIKSLRPLNFFDCEFTGPDGNVDALQTKLVLIHYSVQSYEWIEPLAQNLQAGSLHQKSVKAYNTQVFYPAC